MVDGIIVSPHKLLRLSWRSGLPISLGKAEGTVVDEFGTG